MVDASLRRMAQFAWATLAYNVAVIVWGAYVRATGAGAGCGNHWPLCNGEIVPRAARLETIIEFSHRASSGLAAILVLALLVVCWRLLPKKHPARFASLAAALLMVSEALVGAALVKFGWVAGDRSVARAISLPIHSTNTMLLLAAITLTAAWLSFDAGVEQHFPRGKGLAAAALLMVLVTTAAGVVAALGDTLFPTATISQDFSAGSHLLLRLRVFHPALAMLTAGLLAILLQRAIRNREAGPVLAGTLAAAICAQLILGVLNIALKAPVWLQLVHLGVADAVWVGTVVIAAGMMVRGGARALHRERAPYSA